MVAVWLKASAVPADSASVCDSTVALPTSFDSAADADGEKAKIESRTAPASVM
jgi:hypothetical protein